MASTSVARTLGGATTVLVLMFVYLLALSAGAVVKLTGRLVDGVRTAGGSAVHRVRGRRAPRR